MLKLALGCVQGPQPVQTAPGLLRKSFVLGPAHRECPSLLFVAADREQLGAIGALGHETVVVKRLEERTLRIRFCATSSPR